MKNTKNIDSIRKINSPRPLSPVKRQKKFLNMDGVVRRAVKPARSKQKKVKLAYIVPFKRKTDRTGKFIFFQKLSPAPLFRNLVNYKSYNYFSNPKSVSARKIGEKWRRAGSKSQVSIVAAVLALFLAFGGGIWATLSTSKTAADNNQPQVLADSTNVTSGPVIIPGVEAPPQDSNSISNDALFNTPIQELQNYFADVSQPDIIANRTTQLAKFLNDRHSPFASAAGTIANQSHWDLILAIAFAESTLGKNCTDNNCSNIGVGPNSPLWHKYASYQDWVVSFNRLLDKRYNNWTLEQMCGVYVKPCTSNWLMATKEILADLKDRGIE